MPSRRGCGRRVRWGGGRAGHRFPGEHGWTENRIDKRGMIKDKWRGFRRMSRVRHPSGNYHVSNNHHITRMKIQHFLAALALMGSAHAGTEAPKDPIPPAPAPLTAAGGSALRLMPGSRLLMGTSASAPFPRRWTSVFRIPWTLWTWPTWGCLKWGKGISPSDWM